jgi:ABC-type Fe3+-siderophore transport system permease subunit
MLEELGSFMGGALVEHFRSHNTKPFRIFLITFLFFMALAGIICVTTPNDSNRSWINLLLGSAAISALGSVVMVFFSIIGKRKR